jgi:mono/diheme cytochrome c family protein
MTSTHWGAAIALFCFGAACGFAEDRVKTEIYTVVDGNKVDPETFQGFRAWRAAACDRCHGANQEGLVGPSLVQSLKSLSKEDFKKTVTEGRLEKGMPSFRTSKIVVEHLDNLYAYLKGRSDGAIKHAKVELLKPGAAGGTDAESANQAGNPQR